jgi:hypothetical protein
MKGRTSAMHDAVQQRMRQAAGEATHEHPRIEISPCALELEPTSVAKRPGEGDRERADEDEETNAGD